MKKGEKANLIIDILKKRQLILQVSHDINHDLKKAWDSAFPKKTAKTIMTLNATAIAQILMGLDFVIKAHIRQ